MSSSPKNSRELFLAACGGQSVPRPPIWIMRQAGRYLSEYRELKQKYGFLGIVKNPEIAVEAALQPMRRFDFDCAIAFSDILTIPEALGFPYRFKDGGGIMLERTVENADDAAIDSPAQKVREKLGYVAENISLLRSSLPEKAVFGFCGSPFTLAAYMVEGGGSKTFPKFTRFMRECPDAFERLMEALCSAAGEYALMQAERGIDAFQIFDSNAFLIPDGKYFELSGKWNAKVFSKISGKAKTFLFSPLPSGRFAELLAVGSDAYSIYTGQDMSDIRAKNPGNYVLQGNLDPMLLSVATPAEVERETLKILSAQKRFGRHIFNLGHGILPDAKIENVEAMRKCVAEFK